MPRLEMRSGSRLSPDQVVQALTDFSPRRPQMWTGITSSYYEVHSVGDSEAHVREGTKQGPLDVWAKEHYDWSTPGVVSWTVEESNFCTPGSYVKATITPRDDGGSDIRCEWERTPTTFMTRLVFVMLKLTGGKAIEASMRKGLANYEREMLPD
ncbi:MAG TPA: hypothetical protein VJ927_10675 [Actinomycetota bacterium]|nr:hypothetical protein [Actinomycetota bacterium]